MLPFLSFPINFFIRIYSFSGGIHCDNSKQAYIVHRLDHPPSPNLLSTPLKTITRVSLFYEVHQPYSLTLIFFVHPPTSTPSHTVPILQSCLSLLIAKLMFKGVSQCIPTVSILYFGPFNPFHYTLLPLYFPRPIFQQCSVHILISSTFTGVIFYDIIDALSFSFPSFPEFHRVVSLLQIYSIYDFVHDCACFCVYV
jgi:hypothetical protein